MMVECLACSVWGLQGRLGLTVGWDSDVGSNVDGGGELGLVKLMD